MQSKHLFYNDHTVTAKTGETTYWFDSDFSEKGAYG